MSFRASFAKMMDTLPQCYSNNLMKRYPEFSSMIIHEEIDNELDGFQFPNIEPEIATSPINALFQQRVEALTKRIYDYRA